MRARKMFAATVLAAGFVIGAAIAADAAVIADGQWCTGEGAEANKYWFTIEPDGSKCVADTWMWIKDSDGAVRCYYFDQNGWMLTDTTVDGNTLDKDGRWVVDGVVQTDTEGTKDYYVHNANFINSAKQESAAKPNVPASGTGSSTATAVSSNKPVKSTVGKGDDPSQIVATTDYVVSTVSGKTVSNAWANFTMNFPATSGTITTGAADEGFDIQTIIDSAQLTIRYVPLTQYGGADINSFVAGYIQDGQDGMKGAAIGSDIQLGDFVFKQVSIKIPNPSLTLYDKAYMRVVDGTGFVQVITVVQNGSTEDFMSALSTMKKIV